MSKRILVFSFTIIFSLPLFSENFKFSYSIGEKYRIISNVSEDVYLDEEFSHSADILNKISVYVKNVENGRGLIEANFITSEKTSKDDDLYEFSNEYKSEFYRDENGRYNIASKYFMPVVRDVPVFPDRELFPGDSWTEKAHEVHDFRELFGIPVPYTIPIYVKYVYLGKEDYKGKTYDLFSIRYNVFFKPPLNDYNSEIFPVTVEGESDQLLYWDNKAGRPQRYSEDFEFAFKLSTGIVIKYKGSSSAYVLESELMDKKNIADNIEKQLLKEGINDAGVFESDEGVNIVLNDIQFSANSSQILNTEKDKLDKVSLILQDYPDRDILIKGHTALAGTAEGRLTLSRQRARAVTNYLLENGFISANRIIAKGVGAEEPIADNSTPDGKKKNRRVEIIILEN